MIDSNDKFIIFDKDFPLTGYMEVRYNEDGTKEVVEVFELIDENEG